VPLEDLHHQGLAYHLQFQHQMFLKLVMHHTKIFKLYQDKTDDFVKGPKKARNPTLIGLFLSRA
jgi:hypothetical protein